MELTEQSFVVNEVLGILSYLFIEEANANGYLSLLEEV